MAAGSSRYVPHPPRYSVTDSPAFHAEIERSGEMSEVLPATLIDLSRNGFCLEVSSPLVQDETIVLRLLEDDAGMTLSLAGVVRWRHKSGEDRWVVGCSASETLTWEALGELFLNGILKREHPE
jgi:hypothetical protein